MKNCLLNYLLLLSVLLFVACMDVNLYQKEVTIPNQEWSSDFTPSFSLSINDTTRYYHVFLYVRHRNAYPYNNLWLRTYAITDRDTLDIKKEIVLANEQRWLGKQSTGDVVEHFIPLYPNPIKFSSTSYTLMFDQIMRDDPLRSMMAVGVRVEPIEVVSYESGVD